MRPHSANLSLHTPTTSLSLYSSHPFPSRPSQRPTSPIMSRSSSNISSCLAVSLWKDDSVVAHVLTCLASISLRAALFTVHVTFSRNAYGSLSLAPCSTICCFDSHTGLATAIPYGCPTITTNSLSVYRRVSSEYVAREGKDIIAPRNQS